MGIKARNAGTNKQATSARAKARDRRLLAKADREAAEGKAASGYLLSPPEYISICEQLKELTHVTVDAWATRDGYADGLEQVLVKLHAARRNLESAVEVQS